MRIDLWSYNYEPEPTGIAPISGTWARAMAARGHSVRVIAAAPHYPAPVWGSTWRPRREDRDGIPVYRLPIWPGRHSTAQRLRQEISYSLSLGCQAVSLTPPDVLVAVSPSFPALAPTMLYAAAHRRPWILWLQDILPDGAAATALLEEGLLLRASRQLELAAYRSAARIVVISDSFHENLTRKGVFPDKIRRIYNPATRELVESRTDGAIDAGLVLAMGNVGFSQGLREHVEAFEACASLAELGARLLVAGDGLAGDEVRAAITTDRVNVTGIVTEDILGDYLRRAAVAFVTQRYEGTDFNVPSKLMNFMASGLPVVASVAPGSEVERIIERSGGGWVSDASEPRLAAELLGRVLKDPVELRRRGHLASDFARLNFHPDHFAGRFELAVREAFHPPTGPRWRAFRRTQRPVFDAEQGGDRRQPTEST